MGLSRAAGTPRLLRHRGPGRTCWNVFDDAALETAFCKSFPEKVLAILGEQSDISGLTCEVELTEVAEV